MSTFSGLNGALTSLLAQRRALEIAGQNIANVNTPGYTRQRATLASIDGAAVPSMFSAPTTTTGGVVVSSVDRLGDAFLEARVREESVNAGYLGAVSTAWDEIEAVVDEPGEDGLSAHLSSFFAGWQDVANSPDETAARAVLLESAHALVSRIATAYTGIERAWTTMRGQADSLTGEVNATAAAVADLNDRVLQSTVAGGNPATLVDERTQQLTRLAELVGAEARPRSDGTVDVMVGGNALVRGTKVNALVVQGAPRLADLATWDPSTPSTATTGPVRLVWQGTGTTVGATGGRLGGLLTALAPASTSGPGGPLATVAATYDDLAIELATAVNAAHATGRYLGEDPSSPDPDTAFFTVSTDPADGPPSLNLAVAITDVRKVRAAAAGAGALDGSVADVISQLEDQLASTWSQTVVNIGVQTRTATQRAGAAQTTLDVATSQLQSQAGVNLDEETIQLLASQRAYEGAARVITAIDQLLDTLINRTGIVGR